MHPPTPPAGTDLSALSPLADELAAIMARVASDIALVIDRDGVIRTVAEGQSPLSPSTTHWVGRRWVDTVTQDTQRKIEMLLDEVRGSGTTRRREVNHPGGAGDSIPVSWSAVRLGVDGPVVAVGRDMRAVAAIQQRLVESQREIERDYWRRRQNESRHRLLYQVARDAVLVLETPSLRVLECNEAAAEVLGIEVAAIGAQTLPEMLPHGARAAISSLLVSAHTSGRAGEIRLRLDAGARPIDLSATPFRAGDAQRVLLRARVEEPGDDALAAMAHFVDSTPDAAAIVDSGGHVLMANAAMLSMVHRGNETELRGFTLPDLVGDGLGAWQAMLTRTRQTGIVPQALLSITAPGHASSSVQVTATLMAEGEQECVGLLVRPRYGALVGAPSADLLFKQLVELGAGVGSRSLDELLAEAQRLAETHLIHAAMKRAGGSLVLAASMLSLSPESLMLRLHRLGMSVSGGSAGDAPTTIN